MARANKGDLVVICVDKHAEVMTELENWSPQAQAGSGVSADAPRPTRTKRAGPAEVQGGPGTQPVSRGPGRPQPERLGPSRARVSGVSAVPPCSAIHS